MTAALPFRRPGLWLAAVFAAVLGGCAGLFTEPPKKLYRVTPVANFPPRLPHVPAQLLIDLPSAPFGLDTDRIALSRSPLSLDYFADSQWTDRTPALIQTALLDSFENSGDIAALDREAGELHADFALRVQIRHFEAIYDSADKPPRIAVTLNVRLVDLTTRAIVAQKSVTQEVTAADNDIPQIVAAFDQALGAAMRDIVVWTVTTPALAQKPPLPPRAP
ncbi:MAG TPA: ABC-type transport auxiliary lipoprotein family protein [Stellaceae bacterium]|nr:ABC-type transport auxiliary lipoprotein family protein [Stellaceae bacterium]